MLYNELKEKIQLQGELAIGDVMEHTEGGKVFYLLLVADTKGVFGQNIIDPSNLDEVENRDHILQWKVDPAEPYPDYVDGYRWMDAITEEGESWHLFVETEIKLPEQEGELPVVGNTLFFVEVPKEWYDEALQNQSD